MTTRWQLQTPTNDIGVEWPFLEFERGLTAQRFHSDHSMPNKDLDLSLEVKGEDSIMLTA